MGPASVFTTFYAGSTKRVIRLGPLMVLLLLSKQKTLQMPVVKKTVRKMKVENLYGIMGNIKKLGYGTDS